jgi:acyl carrier protein|tara:strand:- start:1455 stop:1703 length:249 start_codon:yes stop_codon:yes gene_type:complete
MKKVTEDNVLEAITQVLKLKNGELQKTSALGDFDSWDSLGHLDILSTLDQLFDGQLGSVNEMASADSVDKIIDALRANSLIE